MTSVRVEDTSPSYRRVFVQTWVKGVAGAPDRLKDVFFLNGPDSPVEVSVTSEQYLVVKQL